MSVVGWTLGSGANAIRPSAASAASVATSASTRAVGCERSYQAKPATRARPRTSREAASQRVVRRHEHGGAAVRQLAQVGGEGLLAAAVHAARGLVEADRGRRLALEDDR